MKKIFAVLISVLNALFILIASISVSASTYGYDSYLEGYERVSDVIELTFEEGSTIKGVQNALTSTLGYNPFEFAAGSGSIDIVEDPLGTYGNSVCLTAKPGTQTQFNSLRFTGMTISTGVVVIEGEFLFNDFNTNANIFMPYYSGGLSKASFIATGTPGSNEGKITAGSTSEPYTVKSGEWYKCTLIIDFDSRTRYYLVNDTQIAKYSMEAAEGTFSRATIVRGAPSSGTSVMYADNVRWVYYDLPPGINEVNIDGNTIKISVSGEIDVNSVDENSVGLYLNGENVPVDSVEFYSDNGYYAVVTPAVPLISAMEYTLEVSPSVKSLIGLPFKEEERIITFKTPVSDFDILNVDFSAAASDGKITASVQNSTDSDKTLIMSVLLKKTDGTILASAFSDMMTAGVGECEMSVLLPGVNAQEYDVIFINNWTELKPLKAYVYKNKYSTN